jgi:hypothetical protein
VTPKLYVKLVWAWEDAEQGGRKVRLLSLIDLKDQHGEIQLAVLKKCVSSLHEKWNSEARGKEGSYWLQWR